MPIYPNLYAGQRVTAGLLNSGQATFVRKASNESRTSTTTLADDAELAAPLAAQRFYEISGLIYYSADVNTDLQLRATMPANGWLEFSALTPASSISAATTVTVDLTRRGSGTAFTIGGSNAAGSNSAIFSVHYRGIGYSGDGGNFRWQWAQGTSQTVAAIVRAGSYIRAESAFA